MWISSNDFPKRKPLDSQNVPTFNSCKVVYIDSMSKLMYTIKRVLLVKDHIYMKTLEGRFFL